MAKTAAERQRDRRARMKRDGYTQLQLWVPEDLPASFAMHLRAAIDAGSFGDSEQCVNHTYWAYIELAAHFGLERRPRAADMTP